MKYKLGDICSRLSSGKSISAKLISDAGNVPVYGGNGFRGYTDKSNFNGECAIIGRQGAFCGNVRFFSGEAYMTEHAVVACANDNNDTRYLSYLLASMQLGRLSGQSAQPGLSVKVLSQQEVDMPPLEQQKKVANILTTIEKKIEFNRRINENLEQQAQAFFDKLFVANADPNWPKCMLSDVGSIVAGGTPSKSKVEYYADHGIAWITPKDLSVDKSKFISHGENDISELGLTKSSATKMPVGTVLFSSRAPIGYIAIAQNEVTTNQGFKSVIPNENIGTAYVYFLLKNLLPTIEGMASGSTFKEISGAGMKSIPTVMPDTDTIQLFRSFCEPLFKEQEVLESENKYLSALRDSLLPKLMSGEIDVSELDL